jgi:N6-L-threonylcarbamoyladenine synthase
MGTLFGPQTSPRQLMTLVLGIESSCDETAAAVVRDGSEVLGERVASQVDLHARFGGVIPEVASRSHLEALFPVIDDALDEGGVTLEDIDAIAVTNTPGLVGCLLVGLSGAKGLSLATGKPLIPVNHVHAHVYGALMESAELGSAPWPIASLVVSGGHTSLYASSSPTEHQRLGRTIDDAAGEAYDKVAAVLGLGYPGGPVIDRLAADGNPTAYAFPRTRLAGLDFSFSGLKTAVVYAARGPNTRRGAPLLPDLCKADLAASFQAAVVDVLVGRLTAAAKVIDAGGLLICGGVAANSALRERAQAEADRLDLPLFLPSRRLATDNAVMIAGLGYHLMEAGVVGGLELDAAPRAD